MNKEELIKLELSIDDINKILQALGTLPFVEVYDLIGRINKQANDQLTSPKGDNPLSK